MQITVTNITQPEQIQGQQLTGDDQTSSTHHKTDVQICRSTQQLKLPFYLHDFVKD